MAFRNDFSMFRGVDKRVRVTLRPTTNITGYTFVMTWRVAPGTADPADLVKLNATFVHEDEEGGIFYVDVEDGDTTALTTRDYSFDIKRTNSGAEAILVWGTVSLLAETTR